MKTPELPTIDVQYVNLEEPVPEGFLDVRTGANRVPTKADADPKLLKRFLENELGVEQTDVVLTSGASAGIAVVFTICRRSSRFSASVAVPTPGFPGYSEIGRMLGWNVVRYDNLEKAERLLHEKEISLIIINTPGNPCGNVASVDEICELARDARDAGIWVLLDVCYQGCGIGWFDATDLERLHSSGNVILVTSLSKRVGIEERIGYLSCSNHRIMESARAVHVHLFGEVSPSAVGLTLQSYRTGVWTHFESSWITAQKNRGNWEVLLGRGGLTLTRPRGGYYAWAEAVEEDADAELLLAKMHVFALSGQVFGGSKRGARVCLLHSCEEIVS